MDRDWRQGVELLKSGNLPDALRVLRDASRANPESFDSHFYLGIAEAKAGKLSQSRESFQKALSLQRDHAPTYFNLGLAFEKEDVCGRPWPTTSRRCGMRPVMCLRVRRLRG